MRTLDHMNNPRNAKRSPGAAKSSAVHRTDTVQAGAPGPETVVAPRRIDAASSSSGQPCGSPTEEPATGLGELDGTNAERPVMVAGMTPNFDEGHDKGLCCQPGTEEAICASLASQESVAPARSATGAATSDDAGDDVVTDAGVLGDQVAKVSAQPGTARPGGGDETTDTVRFAGPMSRDGGSVEGSALGLQEEAHRPQKEAAVELGARPPGLLSGEPRKHHRS